MGKASASCHSAPYVHHSCADKQLMYLLINNSSYRLSWCTSLIPALETLLLALCFVVQRVHVCIYCQERVAKSGCCHHAFTRGNVLWLATDIWKSVYVMAINSTSRVGIPSLSEQYRSYIAHQSKHDMSQDGRHMHQDASCVHIVATDAGSCMSGCAAWWGAQSPVWPGRRPARATWPVWKVSCTCYR